MQDRLRLASLYREVRFRPLCGRKADGTALPDKLTIGFLPETQSNRLLPRNNPRNRPLFISPVLGGLLGRAILPPRRRWPATLAVLSALRTGSRQPPVETAELQPLRARPPAP